MAPPTTENPAAEPENRPAVTLKPTAPASDPTLSEVLMTVRKHKYVIIVIGLLGMMYGYYKGIHQPRLFEAYGRIEIRSGSSNQYRVSGTSDNSSSHLPTDVAILKSDSLLFNVAQDMDLANNPEFLGMAHRGPHRNTEDPAVRQEMIGRMQGVIDVTTVGKTDLIRISARTLNAKLSADIVNKLIDEYVQRSFKSRVFSTQKASDWLTTQLDELKHQVETSQEGMIDMQKRLGMLAIDPGHNQTTSSLESLTSAADSAEIGRIVAESRYRVLTNMDPSFLDQTVANNGNVAAGALSGLRSQRETLQVQLAQLTTTQGPELPTVKAIRNQIDELTKVIQDEQNRVIAQAKETYVAAQANEQQTRGALEAEKAEAYKLNDDLVEYTLRQREFESNRSLYEGLLSRLRTAGVQAGLDATEIDIIDQAAPPPGPSMQSVNSFVTTDTMVAVILGIILAFLLESLDTGLRSVAEIEAISGLPSLALIPRARRTGIDMSNMSVAQRNIVTLSNPKSQFTESFRALRTSLLLSTAGGLPEVILLTSATPSEGKTTVAANLACVLSQRDVRVLLIDADLRRPTIHHRLGLNGKIGLTSVLTGSISLEDAVQKIDEAPNLDVLVSGPVPPFPTEMLGSETMKELLLKCRGIYTHIVIDSPPLLSVTDGVVLARDADAVVLIVRHGKSSKHAVRRSRDLLVRAGAPLTGICLNAVDLNSPEYYGYYGYTGYSGYSSYGAAGVGATGWESGSTAEKTEKGDKL